jgi:hypothetical protein
MEGYYTLRHFSLRLKNGDNISRARGKNGPICNRLKRRRESKGKHSERETKSFTL